MLEQIFPNIMDKLPEFYKSIMDTCIMLFVGGGIAIFLGSILGVVLVITKKDGIMQHKLIYTILSKIVDLFRAIPFIILIMVLAPLTRMIMGTTIQLKGAIFPLIIGVIPFFARQIEAALTQIDEGLIEASIAMGCSKTDIIFRVYLKESIPSIIHAVTITMTSTIGYIAMVGVVGGGGIGDFCIRYGYYGYKNDVIFVCVCILLLITTLIQAVGNYLVKKTTH